MAIEPSLSLFGSAKKILLFLSLPKKFKLNSNMYNHPTHLWPFGIKEKKEVERSV